MSMCNECQQQEDTTHTTSDLSLAPKKCNLGTLFKKHETKIREEQEQASGGSTSMVETEEQRRHQVNLEVENYLLASRLDFEEDPLLWWKAQPFNYPSLGKAAQKYLCVCATSSASERLFSTAGNVVSSFRATLKPDKVDILVFLSKNLSTFKLCVKKNS